MTSTRKRAAIAVALGAVALGGLLAVDSAQRPVEQSANASRCETVEPASRGFAAATESGVLFDTAGNRYFTNADAQRAWYVNDPKAERVYCVASIATSDDGLVRVWLEGSDAWNSPRRVPLDARGMDYCGDAVCAEQYI